MFGLGFWEIAAVVIVLLLVIKPTDLPRFLRQLGGFYGRIRDFSKGVTKMMRDVESEVMHPFTEHQDLHEAGQQTGTTAEKSNPIQDKLDKEDSLC